MHFNYFHLPTICPVSVIGQWQGTLKTVIGFQSIKTPFFDILFKDVHNIKLIQIPSIGQPDSLDQE